MKCKLCVIIAVIVCFFPIVSPTLALCLGILFSLLKISGAGWEKQSGTLLKASVVLMGFGMSFTQVVATSKSSFLVTAVSVGLILITGVLLGRLLKVDSNVSWLIAAGTAICGGSAIAAIAPVIKAKEEQITFALVVVFVLNAIALLVFPFIGHLFHLNQITFGYWAAIAIHDTSSVVGAGAAYGTKALEVATIVKLTRALWIIPVSIGIVLFQPKGEKKQIAIPWFIFLFVAAILLTYFVPDYSSWYNHLAWLGKRGLVVALFFIGSSISFPAMKQSGMKSFVLGGTLWVLVCVISLLVFIHL
jgi:uncharacterized integral membrane protein (TIGR00698 family)